MCAVFILVELAILLASEHACGRASRALSKVRLGMPLSNAFAESSLLLLLLLLLLCDRSPGLAAILQCYSSCMSAHT